MSDPRFRPLSDIATPAELRDAAASLRHNAKRSRDYAFSAKPVPEEVRARAKNRAAMLDRIAEWLDHQATACPPC
jgi:hypothetical protein